MQPTLAGIKSDTRMTSCIIFIVSIAHGYRTVKPTNSEFIALIADKLQLQLKSSEVVNFQSKNKAEEMYTTIGIQPAEVSYILSLAM